MKRLCKGVQSLSEHTVNRYFPPLTASGKSGNKRRKLHNGEKCHKKQGKYDRKPCNRTFYKFGNTFCGKIAYSGVFHNKPDNQCKGRRTNSCDKQLIEQLEQEQLWKGTYKIPCESQEFLHVSDETETAVSRAISIISRNVDCLSSAVVARPFRGQSDTVRIQSAFFPARAAFI